MIRKMNPSSKPPVTGVPKSDTHGSKKDQKKPVKHVKFKTLNDFAATQIQRAWLCHMDKRVFQLLKHTICAAQSFATYEILRKVSPSEAKLMKDPTMKCKVRFRFSGEKFPPFIVFKIFLQTEGHGYKYISGKNVMKASNEGVHDACKRMGERKFIEQILEDERLFQKFKVTDEIDIVTMKDYMKYSSLMDETPAYAGGRNNYWRRLNLDNFPRTTMMYDIIAYAESGTVSARLQKEWKYLSQRPKTKEMLQQQLQMVSKVRSPSPSLIITPLYRPYKKPTEMKHLGRRSKTAQMKVEKMRKAYTKEKDAPPVTELKLDPRRIKKMEVVAITPTLNLVRYLEAPSNEECGKDKGELYTWSEDL
ncbi:uncharacterized protein CXorf58 homolog isoform X1 [Echinops telfairi]|uniref:Uncharacterized protein CXorf58 homolog isoform X1 n=2 Tax=Echinops telfairi TaxID=9371 RepID=A0AC55D4N2_ECHTE|nr:uncharacterized protein CXorf58 homolog isoform X1 [Echinops telfairi]XP_045146682.1 uncharacterized protein CXorf58 homolog isoform X1 [Echinops telfairi]